MPPYLSFNDEEVKEYHDENSELLISAQLPDSMKDIFEMNTYSFNTVSNDKARSMLIP